MTFFYISGEIIADRYQIVTLLGQGGVATTYRALDTNNNTEVAIKTISLKGIENWKQIELFKREAEILQQLNHPGIPNYIDYFEIDTIEDRYFHLVQQLAPGNSLHDLIANGWCPDEKEVKNIASSILKILVYLQYLSPPIIHRDIKPQNIIRQENGEVFLVDFGAVANVYNHTFKSTVVGTFGYMSPEQFRGKATLSTDIYGLGTTLLFLLTKKCPAELPHYHFKINFRPYLKTNDYFIDWLEQCILPALDRRFGNASIALAALQGKTTLQAKKEIYRLQGSPIKLVNEQDKLTLIIPPIKEFGDRNLFCFVLSNFYLLWYGAFLFIFFLILLNLDFSLLLHLIFVKVLIEGLWVIILLLIVSPLCFIRAWLFRKKITILSWQNYLYNNPEINSNIIITYPQKARLKKYKLPFFGKYLTYCIIVSKLEKHSFGFLLNHDENKWLVREINSFLASED